MVNYDLPWNPNRIEQRFGRIHRIGQTEVCHLWNLVADETREGEVLPTACFHKRGLELDGVTPEEKFTVTNAKTMHLTEMEALSRQKPIDIALVSIKSYDTEWATALIKQYLAPDGYRRVAAELHQRGAHRRRRRLGQDRGHGRLADLGRHVRARPYPPHHRQGRRQAHRVPRRRGPWPHHPAGRGAARHGGRDRQRQDDHQPVGRALVEAGARTAWRTASSAATGLPATSDRNDAIRRFSIKLGGEAVRVGQALGFQLEQIGSWSPRPGPASEGDTAALAEVEAILDQLEPSPTRAPTSSARRWRRTSCKGRRTEIEFINGYIAAAATRSACPRRPTPS